MALNTAEPCKGRKSTILVLYCAQQRGEPVSYWCSVQHRAGLKLHRCVSNLRYRGQASSRMCGQRALEPVRKVQSALGAPVSLSIVSVSAWACECYGHAMHSAAT